MFHQPRKKIKFLLMEIEVATTAHGTQQIQAVPLTAMYSIYDVTGVEFGLYAHSVVSTMQMVALDVHELGCHSYNNGSVVTY